MLHYNSGRWWRTTLESCDMAVSRRSCLCFRLCVCPCKSIDCESTNIPADKRQPFLFVVCWIGLKCYKYPPWKPISWFPDDLGSWESGFLDIIKDLDAKRTQAIKISNNRKRERERFRSLPSTSNIWLRAIGKPWGLFAAASENSESRAMEMHDMQRASSG